MVKLSERLLKSLIFLSLGLCFSYSNSLSQNIYQNINPSYKKDVFQNFIKDDRSSFQINYIPKRIGHYSLEDWADVIDSTWGDGLPTIQKLEIFDRAYDYIDQGYGAFVNLDINLDSLYNLYRPEIAGGVSKGRFAAIMNYLSMALMDGHTYITDLSLYDGIQQRPGLPLFLLSTARNNAPFGACLTPLPDSTLLVYRALPNHKLGLVPGDIVLGYDRIPWKDLYKEIIKTQLPIALFYVFGSTNESMTHYLLQSAGLNWHLFDTINIVKYSTGDTLHLSTKLMMNQTGNIWGNEQLNIPGVEQPDFYNEDYITWGIVEGTNIGYIYIAGWNWEPEYRISEQFYNAVDSLMNENETSGMIIDMRCNYGGSMIEADEGYSLLFNRRISKIGFDLRGDPNNHFDMVQHPEWPNSAFDIQGDRFTYYDKPIAVLTGPGAVSNGDWESLRLGYHPMARVFGKPTCGAYTLNDWPDLGYDSWFFTRATGSGYILPDHEYMAHRSAIIDEEVWLKQEDVANGDDTVVKTAMAWIDELSGYEPNNVNLPINIRLEQNYPNPFNPSTTIKYSIPKQSNVVLKVFNLLGSEITTLVNKKQSQGNYEVEFYRSDLSSGIYFYKLRAGDFMETKKMILIK
jgi:hypothetical protein